MNTQQLLRVCPQTPFVKYRCPTTHSQQTGSLINPFEQAMEIQFDCTAS